MTVALVAVTAIIALLGQAAIHRRSTQAAQRAHARREDLLVNQLLHAVGKDWEPAPAAAPAPIIDRPDSADSAEKHLRYTQSPEQFEYV